MRRLSISLQGVLLASLVDCAHDPNVRYELRGRLIDERTRIPIRAAAVVAPEIGDSATLDSAGRFVLVGTAVPHCYRVLVDAPGFDLTETSFAVQPGTVADLGDIVLLSSPGRAQRFSRSLPRCPAPRGQAGWDWTVMWGAIHGRVANADGLLFANQMVASDCPGGNQLVPMRAGITDSS